MPLLPVYARDIGASGFSPGDVGWALWPNGTNALPYEESFEGYPAGFALPLRWDDARQGWQSSTWQFRRGHMFLSPGDSPMGLRLPLEALPWVAEEERDIEPERDLFAPRPALGDYYSEVTRRFSHFEATQDTHPEITQQEPADSASRGRRRVEVIHTALCIEARKGTLHVFLPPLADAAHWLDLGVDGIVTDEAETLLAVKAYAEDFLVEERLRKLEEIQDLSKTAIKPRHVPVEPLEPALARFLESGGASRWPWSVSSRTGSGSPLTRGRSATRSGSMPCA